MKYFNGRAFLAGGGQGHGYIAARSQREAVEVAKSALGENFTLGELTNYWSPTWGNAAEAVVGEQSEPGFWYEAHGRFYKFVGRQTNGK